MSRSWILTLGQARPRLRSINFSPPIPVENPSFFVEKVYLAVKKYPASGERKLGASTVVETG
jgi:hypothetical protein